MADDHMESLRLESVDLEREMGHGTPEVTRIHLELRNLDDW